MTTDRVRRIRLQTGRCPECGWEPNRHHPDREAASCPQTERQVRAAIEKGRGR